MAGLAAIAMFFAILGALGFRTFVFLKYGENPELTLLTLLEFRPVIEDWAGVQKIIDWTASLPIEFVIMVVGFILIRIFSFEDNK